jgi:hypothetical protein
MHPAPPSKSVTRPTFTPPACTPRPPACLCRGCGSCASIFDGFGPVSPSTMMEMLRKMLILTLALHRESACRRARAGDQLTCTEEDDTDEERSSLHQVGDIDQNSTLSPAPTSRRSRHPRALAPSLAPPLFLPLSLYLQHPPPPPPPPCILSTLMSIPCGVLGSIRLGLKGGSPSVAA